ncbi:MAG: hypothetical protein A3H32_01875 [Betaproteobacteria bacterium RIFCSPLOWO2_02_FULL_63_19]|nr:MAG: hypothetical protein A3H32_01875 [Betaproteobacteria bacterium RIFCSPLOWO2_02_FULL_63_19]
MRPRVQSSRSISLAPGDPSPPLILLVEDDDADAMLAETAVGKDGGGPYEVLRARTLAKALAAVGAADVHLVLLDLNLPDSIGLETFKRMREATRCPTIIITGHDWPELDKEALDNGAFEIVHKDMLGPDTIARLLRLAESQLRSQRSIEDIEHRYRQLIELSPDAMFVHSDWRITLVNAAALQMFHLERPEQLLGREMLELIAPGSRDTVRERVRRLYESQQPAPLAEVEFMRADGTRFSAEVKAASVLHGRRPAAQVVARDITARKIAEKALNETRARLELALAASQVCTWDYDLRSGEIVLSESWAEMVGAAPGETRTTFIALTELVHPDDLAPLRKILTEVLKGLRQEYAVEHRVRKRTGEWRWIVSRGRVVARDARGRAIRMIGTNLDNSARKHAENQLRESEVRFRSLTELSSDWYWEQDEALRFTYLSAGFSNRTGDDPARLLGRRRWDEPGQFPAQGTWEEHRALLEARKPFRDFEQIRVGDDATEQYLSSSGAPVFDAAGRFKGYRGVTSDITTRKAAEKRLAYLARFDAVTGLPNRELIRERLAHAITQSGRRGRNTGALFANLDGFKLINDSLGHRYGDALLLQVGQRLHSCIRKDDTLGRRSGDEFVLVLADLARADDAAFVAQKILDSFAAHFDLDGQEVYLTASIGLAVSPDNGDDPDALLTCAEAAMRRSKVSSRNAFCFYTDEMNVRAATKLRLNTDLRRALERSEFRLYYQPKVDLVGGALIGMEALLRWQHPERGIVAPMEFVPVLEHTGLIVPVGDWVVEEACRQLRDWTSRELEPVPIAVNLSARQFRRRNLDAVICDIVAGHGLQTGLLELEITESSLMDDPADAIRQLHALRAAGLRVSVDDFGTGYSSLAYLTRLPLSTLKIDRTFVNAAISDPNSATIVRMVIDMAQNLGLDVVAEGIESERHVAFLTQHGCNKGQGYLFGKPMSPEDIAIRLPRRR